MTGRQCIGVNTFMGCCLLIFALTSKPVYAQFKQDKFIIGTYVDVSPDSADVNFDVYKKHVKEAKDAWFNFFSGKNNYNKFLPYQNEATHIKLLRILQQYHIQTFYLTPRGKGYNDSLSTMSFRFTQSLDKQLRATLLGYSIRDEPKVKEADNIRKWVSDVKRNDPGKMAYVNMLPVYAFKSHELYEAYLDTFLVNKNPLMRPDVVSFDFYPFVNGDLRKDYFYNLSIMKQKADGRPLWYYPYTTQHRNYNNPGMYELSFMAFCPVAYGGKGCMYFTYDYPLDTPEPYKYAIRDSAGRLTEKYAYVKAINHYLNDVIGPVVMSSQLYGPYHVSAQPYNQDIAVGELDINAVPGLGSIDNQNILCALFKNADRTDYLYLVNKSGKAQSVSVTLKGHYPLGVQLSAPVLPYDRGATMYAPVKETKVTNDKILLSIEFAPGEARMLKMKTNQ
ncbi:hypothetical protein ACFGVR_20275 [Mucilaginibacter sp. AW1-3]